MQFGVLLNKHFFCDQKTKTLCESLQPVVLTVMGMKNEGLGPLNCMGTIKEVVLEL